MPPIQHSAPLSPAEVALLKDAVDVSRMIYKGTLENFNTSLPMQGLSLQIFMSDFHSAVLEKNEVELQKSLTHIIGMAMAISHKVSDEGADTMFRHVGDTEDGEAIPADLIDHENGHPSL